MLRRKATRIVFSICLAVALLSRIAGAGTTTYTGASGGDFNTAGNWSAGLPGAADTAVISNKTANISATISVGALQLSSNAVVNVNAGTLTVGGGSLNNASISGTGTLVLNGTYACDNVNTIACAIQTLGGTLNINSGSTTTGKNLSLSAGAAINGTAGPFKVNSSTLVLGQNTLIAGSIELDTNAILVVTADATLNGTLTVDGNNNIAINGSGVLTINGAFNIKAQVGTNIPGIITTASTTTTFSTGANSPGFLDVRSSGTVTFNGPVVVNAATALSIQPGSNVIANSTFSLGTGAGISSGGTFTVSATGALTSDNTLVQQNHLTSLLVNQGSITVNSGSLQVGSGSSTGSINGTGGAFVVQSGTFTLGGAASLSGAILVDTNGVLTINNALTYTGSLTFNGNNNSVLNGTGSLTVNGAVKILDNMTLGLPTLTIPNSASLTFASGTNSAGIMTLNSSSNLVCHAPATLGQSTGLSIGSGAFARFDNTVSLNNIAGIAGQGAFVLGASGTMTSDSTGTNAVTVSSFTNQGTVTINSGMLSVAFGTSTGAINATGGTLVLSSGAFSLSGAAALSGAILVDTNATLIVNSALSYSGSLTFNGNSGNTLTGTGSLTVNGPVNILDNMVLSLPLLTIPAGQTLSFGTGTNVAGGMSLLSSSAVACNGSLAMNQNTFISLAANSAVTCAGNVTLDRISNISGNGTLALTASANLTSTNAVGTNAVSAAVTNAGAITSQTGTLNFSGSVTQSAGSITLNGGNLGGTIVLNGGTLTGAGTITGDVTNAATVAPGLAGVGVVNITGNYTQKAAGNLSLELGGATVGTFDRVLSTGSATLNGALNLTFVNAYSPLPADTLAVMAFGSRTGQFSSVNAGASGLIALYTNTAVTLAAGTANPNPIPGVASVSPSSAIAGDPSFVLTVNGANFIDSSVVQFNGSARATTFVSAAKLTAVILTSDVASAGSASVSVVNPAPGGGSGAAANFTINPPATPTAPVITSSLTAAGVKNIPFTYILSATGAQPITYGATGLPAGLAIDTQTGIVSGTPTAAGGFDVSLTAQNTGGTGTQTLHIIILSGLGSNSPPAFTSALTATPNPAIVGQAVQFTAAATDPDNDAVTISWDFGDGTQASGASVSHTYSTPGVFSVTAKASDGIAADTAFLDIAVNAVAPPNATDFAVEKGAIKFSFTAKNKDTLSLLGTLPLDAGTTLTGAQITIHFGDVTKSFTLSDKGSGGDKSNSIKFSGKIKVGKLTAANPKFLITLKSQNLYPDLSDFFGNTTIPKPGETDSVPLILTIDGTSFVDLVKFNYVSTAGKSATATVVP